MNFDEKLGCRWSFSDFDLRNQNCLRQSLLRWRCCPPGPMDLWACKGLPALWVFPDRPDLPEQPVVFNSTATSAPIAFAPPSSDILLDAGSYYINFQVSSASGDGGVWDIAINGAVAHSRNFVSTSGNTQITGSVIITLAVPATITLVNLSGGSVTLANNLDPAPSTAVSASLSILKLA